MDYVNWNIVKHPANWLLVLFTMLIMAAILFFIQPDTSSDIN